MIVKCKYKKKCVSYNEFGITCIGRNDKGFDYCGIYRKYENPANEELKRKIANSVWRDF